jgi:hypothetical protein
VTLLGPLWTAFEERPPVGVQYVSCACGKHIVHVKRAHKPCAMRQEQGCPTKS